MFSSAPRVCGLRFAATNLTAACHMSGLLRSWGTSRATIRTSCCAARSPRLSRLRWGQILKDTQGRKVVKAKRSSDAAATATGLDSAAAAVAASKRARSSLSSGPDVGTGALAAAFERPGEIGNDARASMALAGMIHSEGFSGDFAKKPKVLAALLEFKNTSTTYATSGRKQVDGPLLDALSGQ